VAFDASERILVLLHDGELADVRVIADSLGAQVVECAAAEMPAEWDVIVASARYARHEILQGGRVKAVRIAVLDRNAKSLRAVVRRAGVDLVVRRPVHPTALRLLLLHSLYRGPERRVRRVAVGAPVRFRAGFRRRAGTLADLSLRGCQILSTVSVRLGQGVVVWVPDAASEARSFAVRGAVVRVLTSESGERGFGVDFGRVPKEVAAQLRAAVAAHMEGPAACADLGATQPVLAPVAPSPAQDPNEITASGYASGGSVRREVVRAPDDFAAGIDASDRRGSSRRSYVGRRVVALGADAARVLIGRDLSVGGMRVERMPEMNVGQQFQIAIHVGAGQTPLVVRAAVARDDGERGLVLRFVDLEAEAERYLGKMVDSLPVIQGANAPIVVSEIVEPGADA
jgi:hypothetical protein